MQRWSSRTTGIVLGLAAAASFGISAPLAKRLLDDVEPQTLAGLLSLGAFLGLGAIRTGRRTEARLRRSDAPRLVALVLSGGVVAPVLLLVGLDRVTGVTGSLLLNLEGVFTITLGVLLFREHLPRLAAAGAAVVFAGAVLLGTGTGPASVDLVGVLAIVGACAAWGLDNNLTQSLTVRDPRSIVRIKAGVAGSVNLALGVLRHQQLPSLPPIVGALALGAVAYGLSVCWDAFALRALGAAQEAAIFAVAPFAGALVAPFVLPEQFGARELVAGGCMAAGIGLLLRARHDHEHAHESLVHDHVHLHDDHHQHAHDLGTPHDEPHTHRHAHDGLVHAHRHVSDAHHRHSHRSSR